MRFLKSEAGAIILWLVASLFAAALLTPHLYEAGKDLALSAAAKDYPPLIESIASSARRAKLDRFFSRSLLISALALLPVLIRRIRKIPRSADADRYHLRKLNWPQRLFHLVSGLFIGAVTLGALALVLHFSGASQVKDVTLTSGKLLSKALVPALGAGVIEELVFRGLLLGLWLRACSLRTASIGSALMFSFVHFLSPPAGVEISDPDSWHSGLEILASTLGHFTNPLFFVTDFATLTLLGYILAWCRTKTYALWLPIGIHAGLVFALKSFSLTQNLNPASSLYPWLIGSDLKSGVLPLIFLAMCFYICTLFVRHVSAGKHAHSG